MICLTAHNPRFTREDVVDRLIILQLRRRTVHLEETRILADVTRVRNALWSDMIADAQQVLGTSMPTDEEVPAFRIADFAKYGLWFSQAHSKEMAANFSAAIARMVGNQQGLNLESDQVLVATIQKWLRIRASKGIEPGMLTATNLWNELHIIANDPNIFQRMYHNPQFLSRKLMNLKPSLDSVMIAETVFDIKDRIRKWHFELR
jgi:hypothetical protein